MNDTSKSKDISTNDKVKNVDVSNKNWIEYLAKSRDVYEKSSSENVSTASENQRQTGSSSSLEEYSPNMRLKKRTSVSSLGISVSASLSTPKLDDVKSDFEGYSKALVDNLKNPKSPLRNTLETTSVSGELPTKPDQQPLQGSIQIRIVELQKGGESMDILPEYKTISVNAECTVLELLLLVLRKWRYLDPKQPLELVNNRPTVEEKHRQLIENERWQIVKIVTLGGQSSVNKVDLGMRCGQMVQENVPNGAELNWGFRRESENPILTDYHKSSLFQPCHVLKLDSTYPADKLQGDIDITNWAKRYIILAKNRYLLFFKSENQSRWVQNVLHEIDFARVTSVEKASITVTDPTNLITLKGSSDTKIAKFSLKICTRTRVIALACVTETDRDRIVSQLNDVCSHTSIRKSRNKFNAFQGDSKTRTDSTQSFEASISPMIRLIARVEQTSKLNDIDLPPFAYDPKTTEWLSWTISTNHSLFLTVKQLAYSKLKTFLSSEVPVDFAVDTEELLGMSREHAADSSRMQQLQDKSLPNAGDTSSTFSSVKRFLTRGFSTQPSGVSHLSLPDGNTGSGKPPSGLFGVPLEELSQRHDLSGIGVPIIPPIVKQSVAFLREKGLNASGLFRIAGSVKRVELLKKAYEKMEGTMVGNSDGINTSAVSIETKATGEGGGEIDYSAYNVHDVAGVLKMFFRDLPDPLLTGRLYRAFLSTDKLKSSSDKQLKMTQLLIMLLPPINRHLLELLLEFMFEVAQNAEDKTLPNGEVLKGNLMNASNLAVVMGPNILREVEKSVSTPSANTLGIPQRAVGHSRSGSFTHGDSAAIGLSQLSASSTADDDKKTSAAQELSDSTSVVNVVKFMIERHQELFVIPKDFMEEMKKLSSFTTGSSSPSKKP